MTLQRKRVLLNLGCGPLAEPSMWRDCDGSWNAQLNCLPSVFASMTRWLLSQFGVNTKLYQWPRHVQFVSLNRRLPYADESVDAIFASHVWEHLYLENAVNATTECLRILNRGGVLRLVVPDLKAFCEDYLASQELDAALELNRRLLFREDRLPRSPLARLYSFLTDYHSHKFMYDSAFLCKMLSDVGFVNVSERSLHESGIPEIQEVESPERVGPGIGTVVEAEKP